MLKKEMQRHPKKFRTQPVYVVLIIFVTVKFLEYIFDDVEKFVVLQTKDVIYITILTTITATTKAFFHMGGRNYINQMAQ